MAKLSRTRNFRQTRSERAGTRGNVAFGHFNRMIGWLKTYVPSKTRYNKPK